MPYVFSTKTVATYTDHFTFLDGDPRKITNPDRSVVVGINPPERNQSAICGRPIDPTHLPRRLQPKGRRYKLADMVSNKIGLIVSEKVKDIVEKFEPGVHAFYPITLEWSGKSAQKDDGHSIWIIQRSIKGLHPVLIDPPYTGPNDYWDGLNIIKHPNSTAVFSKDAIGNAHIWADPQLSYQRIISDELTEAFQEAKVTGFAPGRYIEAK
ncbi:imm11 family protein [Thalassobius sp. Cn5-15]|uniref:imm11 family protein n=1 Tax=Thalassobius sp. Cn5-15 TaxID=2917763 RepID=UPI001EF170C4|nr:DUF1629 domain-containing protein [Thalassobius sp. Cn5-15]MCG7495094.1 hypothetical protein [Thalassobius sp. Cn5-15]